MIITPGSSIEIVVGSAVRDRIIGDGIANTIMGGGGNDSVTGGNGADTLWGEAGADVFFYKAAGESPIKSGKFDLIMDFDRIEEDKIDLSTIDANFRKAGNQTFRFDSQGDGTAKTGQISYRIDDGVTHIYGNVDKDKKAEFHIVVNGEIDLQGSDFAL